MSMTEHDKWTTVSCRWENAGKFATLHFSPCLVLGMLETCHAGHGEVSGVEFGL